MKTLIRLGIRVIAGRTVILLVLSWGGSTGLLHVRSWRTTNQTTLRSNFWGYGSITVMIPSFRTDSVDPDQTDPRLEQSDQSLHCLPFCLHHLDSLLYGGERGGSVVECRTPEREVRGSRPTSAVLCPWARHFTPRKYWLITQEAMAPSRHDWKIVDWDVKPQHNQNYSTVEP